MSTNRTLSSIAVLILLTAFIPVANAAGATAIVGGTIVDLEGKAPIENAVIVVEGERIAAIGESGEVKIPEGAERIDVKGAWLIPGLMNMHIHLGLVLPGKMKAELSDESEAALALRMAANARDSLQAGVTTIRLTGDRGHADLDLMRAINKGQADGPRIFSAGEELTITAGHGSKLPVKPIMTARMNWSRRRAPRSAPGRNG